MTESYKKLIKEHKENPDKLLNKLGLNFNEPDSLRKKFNKENKVKKNKNV